MGARVMAIVLEIILSRFEERHHLAPTQQLEQYTLALMQLFRLNVSNLQNDEKISLVNDTSLLPQPKISVIQFNFSQGVHSRKIGQWAQ